MMNQNQLQQNETIDVTCNVTYSGNLHPDFHCQPTPNHTVDDFDNSTLVSRVVKHFQYYVTGELNGQQISCSATFGEAEVISDDLRSKITWKSPALDIFCKFVILKLLLKAGCSKRTLGWAKQCCKMWCIPICACSPMNVTHSPFPQQIVLSSWIWLLHAGTTGKCMLCYAL